jgi:hypothetical protein
MVDVVKVNCGRRRFYCRRFFDVCECVFAGAYEFDRLADEFGLKAMSTKEQRCEDRVTSLWEIG